MSMYTKDTSTVGNTPTIAERSGGWPPKTTCSAIATSWTTIGPKRATLYQKGATRQRTIRLSKDRSPARPLSWAVITTAATIGPKEPKNMAGTGNDEIRPRASRIASNQKNQVNAKATRTYFSGKALVVARDGVVAEVVISSPFSESRLGPVTAPWVGLGPLAGCQVRAAPSTQSTPRLPPPARSRWSEPTRSANLRLEATPSGRRADLPTWAAYPSARSPRQRGLCPPGRAAAPEGPQR